MRIEELDTNFAVSSEIKRKNVKVYDICKPPFKIYGLLPKAEGEVFRRMPENAAKAVSDNVHYLSTNTSGGRVRFRTNSPYIAIQTEMPEDKICRASHFALTGAAGFDMYAEENGKQHYLRTYVPPFDVKDGYASEYLDEQSNPPMRDFTINFPLYSDVSALYIIIDEDANIEAARPYKYEKPVVYYGSSITQGGCASRPGNAYPSIISRRLDCDYINLGFSASARGEIPMAEYIANLDASVFVYDYDQNARTAKELIETHECMFKIIRDKNPELPIICASRPVYCAFEDCEARRQIVRRTVENARKAGDKNVYFVDGKAIENENNAGDSISVDHCHPNDLGFMCMANAIGRVIEKVIK